MREIVHMQAGQCGNQIGAKVGWSSNWYVVLVIILQQVDIFKNTIYE